MATHIDIVQAFKCSHCQKLFIEQEVAAKCYRKCHRSYLHGLRVKKIAAQCEVLSDMPRLGADNFDHAWELVEKYAREKMKIGFKLKKADMEFTLVSNTHGAPIGGKENWHINKDLPKGYLGWHGRIEGEMKILKRFPQKVSHGDLDLQSVFGSYPFSYNVGYTFRGFHSGTGCPAAKFDIEFYMYLDDFPRIHARYLTRCKAHLLTSRLMENNSNLLDEFEGICNTVDLVHKKPQV
jgi:hypothetical protein